MKNLSLKILQKIKSEPDKIEGYSDLFSYIQSVEDYKLNSELQGLILKQIAKKESQGLYDLYNRSLLWEAPKKFDSYLLYLEKNREPKQKFYQPRRKVLKQVVDILQDLTDDKLDEFFLSMPPRVGKTTLLLFYVTWLIGRDSNKSNLYSAYSDLITKAFYNGIIEILEDKVTYTWHEIFPKAKIVQTNAAEETLNIDRKKHYPSLTCRSLYGTLNGACDCNGVIISDDLIGGIEEVLNKDRMNNTWYKVDNNLLTRAKEKAKVLWCGTRWSVIDPMGIREEILTESPVYKSRRVKFLNLPALSLETDKSNFDYDYGVGFTTEYYKQRRASFERNNDLASWSAQYMGEPIERQGQLFNLEDFRYYNGVLPDEEPDRVFMAVDPAFGGGDFVASPVCYQYGEDIYVHDVVFDNGNKRITQRLLANMAIKNNVSAMQIEASKSTESYKDGVQDLLNEQEYRLNITTKSAPRTASKSMRIFDKAPDIKDRMIFRDSANRSNEYEQFMQNVYGYKMTGKNKHDDAPDSLAMAIDMCENRAKRVEIFERFF